MRNCLFPTPMATIIRGINSFLEIMQLINPKYYWKKWIQANKESSRKVLIKLHFLFPIVMTKTASAGSKHIKSYFPEFLITFVIYLSEFYLFLKVTFFKIPLMANLNILWSDPPQFLKEVTKKLEKYVRKHFVAHQKFS